MNIFVINSGSSSIKYQLFQMPLPQPVCSGLADRIGSQQAVIKHKTFTNGKEEVFEKILPLENHETGLLQIVALLTHPTDGVIKNPDDIQAVGHRVVHGGESYSSATIITDEVKQTIQQLASLAPLHNPANLSGVEVAEKIFKNARQVAVFDTAFHQTMPDYAFRYAVPNELYTKERVRVYGFHGTSHQYVSQQAIRYLGKSSSKIISIHLGNGCSMAAIQDGQCIDTSMGFGPLSGLIMGTRSGDIDPSVIFYLISSGHSLNEVSNILNKQSGMLGLTGSNDLRDVNKAIEEGSHDATLAFNMYAYRIQKYIGSYVAALQGLDAIVFTAGVGENDSRMRAAICAGMDYFGISVDTERNEIRSGEIREISKEGAEVKVLVVPTNEELEIAQQCYHLLEQDI